MNEKPNNLGERFFTQEDKIDLINKHTKPSVDYFNKMLNKNHSPEETSDEGKGFTVRELTDEEREISKKIGTTKNPVEFRPGESNEDSI